MGPFAEPGGARRPGIRVNCICPGTVPTGMPEAMFRARGDGDVAAGVAVTEKEHLPARLRQPEQIAGRTAPSSPAPCSRPTR